MIKNKARLVAQGYTQEEGIDYDEVFTHVARIEVIRIFLAYALFKDFVVYQMDVKSAFRYGKIEEEVYVCQPPEFEDPDFPDRELQVKQRRKGFLSVGDKYVRILKKMLGFYSVLRQQAISYGNSNAFAQDKDVEEVDVHLYKSMIGSLTYLTSLRPDNMFAVCVCARYQVNPKVSHLHM
ncbi:retrovirus-related pol polyprotein from transposon TNT 1-94 [Tanacetum coccineum]